MGIEKQQVELWLRMAMESPDDWVLRVRYTDKSAAVTERIVSPIRFDQSRLRVFCLGRGGVRVFDLKRLDVLELVDAAQVVAPCGVADVVQ